MFEFLESYFIMASSEEKRIQELRERLDDLIGADVDDDELRKWLIARNFDVSKAEKMYRESYAYKKRINADNLLSTYKMPEILEKYFPGGFVGFDKDGSPILVELFGKYDMEGLMRSCTRSDLEKVKVFQCLEVIRFWKEQSAKLGRKVEGLTVIFDMEGVGAKFLWRPGLEMYLNMVKILEDNYPEMMKRLCVVNAPVIFPILWKITRPMVSSYMRKKIFVLDAKNCKEQLLKFIDEDTLPAYLGGKMTDPDGNPRCITMIGQGGQIPTSYYLQQASQDDMTSVTISNGEKFTENVNIGKAGVVLCWQFRTECHDIGFEIRLLENSEATEGKVVVPHGRFNAEVITEDGSHVCTEAGTYQVVFDNSHSWTRSKTVSYRIWTLEDTDESGFGPAMADGLDKFLAGISNETDTKFE